MAVALAQVGRTSVRGDKEYNTFDLTLSGTYATGGEAITALQVNLQAIEEVILPPVTAGGFYPTQPVYNADGSINLLFFEPSAAAAGVGSPFQQKTNSEAYIASTALRAVFV